MSDENLPQNRVLLYKAENGKVRVEVEFDGETVWLSQALLAELYQTTSQNITQHIREIYEDGECEEEATCKQSLQVRHEGDRQVRRSIRLYNLTMILAIGFRVRSNRGILFRQWAGERLQEYALKGFAIDDDRLKAGGGGLYFDELLARIRDIRSSEKVFWRKVLDIYATSIDYDPSADASKEFFATVQNKMHWAVHGHTAAELVVSRLDANAPHMGMTSWGRSFSQEDGRRRRQELSECRRARRLESSRRCLSGIRRATGLDSKTDEHGRVDRQTRRLSQAFGPEHPGPCRGGFPSGDAGQGR